MSSKPGEGDATLEKFPPKRCFVSLDIANAGVLLFSSCPMKKMLPNYLTTLEQCGKIILCDTAIFLMILALVSTIGDSLQVTENAP